MNIRIQYFFVAILLLVLNACGGKKKQTETATAGKVMPYRSSVTMVNDLQHTKLELEPDFEKKELKGTATLLIKPHFYPVDSLLLHAKHMRIESVEMLMSSLDRSENLSNTFKKTLNYNYDSTYLRIALDRRYISTETYTVVIKYVAMPERAGGKGSHAITDSKGVYFIGPNEKNPDKPVQMWTQGETEAASCWFPTIDAPNQKTTQELSVTVPAKYKTISNGKLQSSVSFVRDGKDSMRTDFWLQDKPHAPYLFALAVGDFAEVKDKWGDMPVHYYVEKEFEPYARLIFGNTPEMIEFFSKILSTGYPWDKYHQVVVRDFVSGAMENTSCVIHFDKLQHNSRQHLDNTYEEVISHELFHHWFGDLVTCESWSNLPLNESFATYGEYLWEEYKYSRDEADDELQNFRDAYFGEAEFDKKKMIRYDYNEQEEMFDAHSYQKGGMILHSLRKYVGDAAFFESLRLYLQRYRYSTAELSSLRTCFEEVTGEDLNWFFNQWFFQEGHAGIVVNQSRVGNTVTIKVKQVDKVYKLPFQVQIGLNRVENIMVTRDTQTFVFTQVGEEDMVVFDGQNQFIGEMSIVKSVKEWKLQFAQTRLAHHKIEAFNQLISSTKISSEKAQLCKSMIYHSFRKCRQVGMAALYDEEVTEADMEPMRSHIIEMGTMDPNSKVRNEVVRVLTRLKEEKTIARMLNDSSYVVAKRALLAYGTLNKKAAYEFADAHRNETDPLMLEIIYVGIGKFTEKDEMPYFIQKLKTINRKQSTAVAQGLSYYLLVEDESLFMRGIDSLKTLHATTESKIVKSNVMTVLRTLKNNCYYDVFFSQYYIDFGDKQYKKYYKAKKKQSQARYDYLSKLYKELSAIK